MGAPAGGAIKVDPRVEMILKDIYARNNIKPGDDPATQEKKILLNSRLRGLAPSAWKNPEEKYEAVEKFARNARPGTKADFMGETPQGRFERGTYLIDPRTYQYQQGPGRDLAFIKAHHAATGGKGGQWADRKAHEGIKAAIEQWDNSNFNPLERDHSLGGGNYADSSGVVKGMQNAVTNPDVPLGWWSGISETVPDTLRLRGSGEAPTLAEAWKGAKTRWMATNRYRMDSMSPMLNLPDNATDQEIADRKNDFEQVLKTAAIPNGEQRWARWTKDNFGKSFVPPGWITDTGDALMSTADPTIAIPIGGALVGAAKVGLGGAKVAGSGWVRNLLTSLGKKTAAGAAVDQSHEQAFGHGVSAALGGQPGRTERQFWFGRLNGEDVMKSDSEVADSRQVRDVLHGLLKDDDRVSTARNKAYKNLMSDGLIGPSR